MNLSTTKKPLDGLQTRSSVSENGFTLSLCYGDRVLLELVSEDLIGLSVTGIDRFFGAQTYGIKNVFWDSYSFHRRDLEDRIMIGFSSDMDRSDDRASIYRGFALLMGRVGFPSETARVYVSRVELPDHNTDATTAYCLHSSPEFYEKNYGRELNVPEDLCHGVSGFLLRRLLKNFGLNVPNYDDKLLAGAAMYASMLLKAYYMDAGCNQWSIDAPGAFEDLAHLRSEPEEVKKERLARVRKMTDYAMIFNRDIAYVLATERLGFDSAFTETLQEFVYHFRTTTPEIAMSMYGEAFSSVPVKSTVNELLLYAYESAGLSGSADEIS